MGKIDDAVQWAKDIANDNTHGYDQTNRWGPDYDCSSFVISAWDAAGVSVKSNGASNTRDMCDAFLKSGFTDVTSQITISDGSGLVAGDVLWKKGHTCAAEKSQMQAKMKTAKPQAEQQEIKLAAKLLSKIIIMVLGRQFSAIPAKHLHIIQHISAAMQRLCHFIS